MSSRPADPSHPVAYYAVRAGQRLGELTGLPLWSMVPEELRQALVDLTRLESQVAAMRLKVLAEADRVGATTVEGAGSAADWVAVETRQTRYAARA